MNNKQRPRIRPVGALAAVAARKQAPSEPNANLSGRIDSTSEQTENFSVSSKSAAIHHVTETQTHKSTAGAGAITTPANVSTGAFNAVRRTAPSVIRPGAAALTLRQSITSEQQETDDSFAREFQHIDATVPQSSTNSHNIASLTASHVTMTQFPPLPPATMDTTGSLVPYQHLGLLDPSWDIPPPKPGEKTLKAFCSAFKVPRLKKQPTDAAAATTAASMNSNNHTTSASSSTRISGTSRNAALNSNRGGPDEIDRGEDSANAQRSGPLVEVINGEIVIRESSLILGARRPTTEEVDRELENVVVEESTGITATYNSFTKRQKTQHWSPADTKRFFSALRQCGTDFTTMETLFNSNDEEEEVQLRTRKQLKNKYLIECRKHPHLIDMAMNPSTKIPVDLTVFGELEIGTVVPPLALPAPIPTAPTHTTITIPDAIAHEEEMETTNSEKGANSRQLSSDAHTRHVQWGEESMNNRYEDDFFEDEFTSPPHLEPVLPVIKPFRSTTTRNKNHPFLKMHLKANKSSSKSAVATKK